MHILLEVSNQKEYKIRQQVIAKVTSLQSDSVTAIQTALYPQ